MTSDGHCEDGLVEASIWNGDVGVEGEGLGDHIAVGGVLQDQLEGG